MARVRIPLVVLQKAFHCLWQRGDCGDPKGVSAMTVWRLALALACLATGAVMLSAAQAQFRPSPGGQTPPPADTQPQPESGDRFTFRVCNQTKIQLFAAVLYRLNADSWRMFGWTPYKPGVCGPVRGTYPRDDFFWYVEDGPSTVTFPGNDAQGCINPKDNFDRTVTGEYQCSPDERIAGFTKIDEKGIRDGITLNR
jgi:hypothetical protein